MAQFGWAYINCSQTGSDGSGSGPPHSLQFVTESGGGTTGSANLTYYTASYLGYTPSTLVLSGNMYITGTVSASTFHVEDIAIIDATGSTYFGDDQTDIHARTGSLEIYSDSARIYRISANPGVSGSGTFHNVGAATLGSTLSVSGNVGIGTTPSAPVHVYKAAASADHTPMELLRLEQQDEGVDMSAGHGPAITFYVGETGGSDHGGSVAVVREEQGDADSAAAMSFYTAGDDSAPTEKMRITSTGKVGIGTTSPSDTLTVAGSISGSSTLEAVGATTLGSTLYVSGNAGFGTASPQGGFHFEASSGPYMYATRNDSTIVDGNDLGGIFFGGTENGAAYAKQQAGIIGEAAGTWTVASDAPARLRFYTTPVGSTSATTRVIITEAGILSASQELQAVGATTLGSTLSVSGSTTLGDAAADVATVTAQLTASQGGYFAERVGIGTAAPIGHLHIQNGYFYGQRNDSTIVDGNDLGGIFFGGTEDGSTYDNNSAVILAEAAGTWDVGDTDTPSRLIFKTTPAESSTNIERLRITKDGLVSGSGTFHNVGAATLGSTLAVSGSTTLGDAAADVATITAQLTASQGGYFAERLGVGTASPLGMLHMEKSSSPYLFISRNDSSIADGNDLGGIHFGGTEDGSAYDKDSAVINAEAAGTWDVGGTDTPSRLRFYTTPAGSSVAVERLRITKDGLVSGSGTFHNVGAATLGSTLAVSGNVGIGIASPAGLLHLEDSANPYIYLTRNDSSIVDGETLGGFLFGGTENGANYDTNSAVIQAKAAGTWDVGGADTPARLIFKTTPAGSSTNATRLSIMEDGLVSGSGTFHNVGASTFGSTIVASGSITAGSSFIIGSADLNETDMEKLDGITNGTATAAKAVVLDASKNIATIGTIGCGAITSTGTSTFTAAEIGGGYGDTGTTLYGNGNIKADGNLIVSGTLHQVGAATFAGAVATTGAISGSSTLHAVGASTFGSTIAASSSITAGSSFIIGSADLNETDLEKLDGITNGTATAAKAVVLDASKNIATIGTVGCGAITSTGTSTFAAAEIGGGYGSTGITLYGNGNLKADGDLVVGGAISGSSVVRLGSSLSASGDVAVTGAIHAANFYGDGSGLTNLSTATSLSGTTAQLTTGVETSGYLKVSGSTTLDGNLVIDGVISASSLVRLGASLSASRDIAVTGAVHAEYYYGDGSNLTNISAGTATALSGTTAQLTTGVETSGYLKVSGSTTLDGLTKAAAYSGSGFLQAVGATTLGSTLNVSGAILGADNIGTTGGFLTASAQLKGLSLVLEGQTAIDKNRNATLNAFSGSGTLQAVGATTLGSTLNVSGTTTLAGTTNAQAVTYTTISGSSTLQTVGATTLGSTLNVSGAILGADNIGTTGGFLTASAQLKGLSLVLEGQTAIDKNRNATLNAFSGSGTLQAVGATTFGSTMEVSGTTTLGNHLIVDGVISGSSILRLGTSISASGDVAATGSMHAEYYYGDGSNLTNISAGTATALSGTTAQLTTGVETSGYLKVSGSTTLAGGVVHARVHKTGHYTVADSDYYIGVDSSGGAVTLTLPAAATFSNGQTWVIKDEAGAANSNNIKITASAGTNTIDGQNYILLESPYASVQLYCNGAAKYFIQ